MSVVVNEVRRATYFDSIVLMRLSREIAALPHVEEAGLMLGTPANKEILREAGILAPQGEKAEPGDLIIALRARDHASADAASAQARRLLEQPRLSAAPAGLRTARTIRGALAQMPDANLALISVPGHFAAAEARKALAAGLHAMVFSDNVRLEDEIALKREARERNLLLMGPDCGTAIINGMPLGFANAVPRGDIGLVGASGTGIQEVSCLIARAGHGISHAIGSGGRDLKAEVGAITTLTAIDALDADPGTRHIVLISKPPAAAVSRVVLDRVARSTKHFTICFLGAEDLMVPPNARVAATLKEAAEIAIGRPLNLERSGPALPGAKRGLLTRGLMAGGTLCAEAQVVFRKAGLAVASNVPVSGVLPAAEGADVHLLLDLGDDVFTRGRPHPMIEPAVRDAPLAAAFADPAVGIVLVDVVLGYGAHRDPAGRLATMVGGRSDGPLTVASVTGTDADPQPRHEQVRKLVQAGIIVAQSNADAAEVAISAIRMHAASGPRRGAGLRP